MNWLWLVPALGFTVLETLALLNRKDKFQPATYWIRKFFMTWNRAMPLYWILAGVWVWLGVHFLIDR